jgi:hypothetical protein
MTSCLSHDSAKYFGKPDFVLGGSGVANLILFAFLSHCLHWIIALILGVRLEAVLSL